MRFDGGLRLSTGANDAFPATGNTGMTLVITDPSGATSNRITTTTGNALDVQNTTVGSGSLIFQSINANGAPSTGSPVEHQWRRPDHHRHRRGGFGRHDQRQRRH